MEGRELVKKIEKAYNTFGSYNNISRRIYKEYDKKSLRILFLTATLMLASERIQRGCATGDGRYLASEKFSYENKDVLIELFQKETGITLDMSLPEDNREYYYSFDRRIRKSYQRGIPDNRKWILESSAYLVNMHPTIKQAFIGGFLKGIMIPEGYIGPTEQVFPFI